MLLMAACLIGFPNLLQVVVRSPLSLFRDREDIILAMFLCLVWIACGLGFGGDRSFNHALAYTFTFVFYLLLFKLAARLAGFGPEDIIRAFAASAVICCAFVLIDSVLANLFDIRIRTPLLTGGPRSFNMDYFRRGLLISTGGTAEEPGSMAMFLNIVVPIGMWHFHTKGPKLMVPLLAGMHLLSMIFMGSTAGILILMCFAGLVAALRIRPFLREMKWILLLGAICTCVVAIKLWIFLAPFLATLGEDIVLKVSLDATSVSASARTGSWTAGLEDFQSSPFWGMGPGYGIETLIQGYLSFFLTVLADTGFLSFLCILLYLALIAWKAMNLQGNVRYFLLLPLFGTLVHFNIVGDYYHAPFWILVALIQMMSTPAAAPESQVRNSAPDDSVVPYGWSTPRT
jgi:hypothetical protein